MCGFVSAYEGVCVCVVFFPVVAFEQASDLKERAVLVEIKRGGEGGCRKTRRAVRLDVK